MKIVIKVGTQAIIGAGSVVLETAMQSLVSQITTLKNEGHQVVLVSSGAVSSGRRVARSHLDASFGETITEKQVLASLGQHELIHLYTKMFQSHEILTGQLLLTKQDFQTRLHYLNIAKILKKMLEQKNIIPIVNENDSVSIEELIFTDNDELAGLIAAQLSADKLIILTSVDGVYNGHPDEADAKLIPLIDPTKDSSWPTVSTTVSAHGRGGMISKLGVSRKLSSLGITTHIANIDKGNAILDIVKGKPVGTTIVARKRKSDIKRWMAFCDWQKNGTITVNTCLYDILKEGKRAISLLPVGIDSCEGNFQKGDLVEVISPGGQQIGIGIARYDSSTLKPLLGLKNKPEIIHYDHLLIKIGS